MLGWLGWRIFIMYNGRGAELASVPARRTIAIVNPDPQVDPYSGELPDDSEHMPGRDEFGAVSASAGAPYINPLTIDALFADPLRLEPQQDNGPSLPIILISAACGIGGGVLGLYISYDLLGFGTAISAGLATLAMLFGLGVSGAALTAATGEQRALLNMAFSCTLILLVALFLAMCAVTGAVIATLLLSG